MAGTAGLLSPLRPEVVMGDLNDTEDAVRRAEAKGDRRAGRWPLTDRSAPSGAKRTNGKATAVAALRLHRPVRSGHGRTTAEATFFAVWLSRSLHTMFDRYKDEAVPMEWLRLIEEDRARRRSG
ncbi:hypothetical protein [Caldovatus aquaticus]|uniref:Uncharacterized protein n=1 Tax=Caldovatus aquaticus TaxID=2865671 RepID=A0ABS7F3R9_9PROT|nr:hypothetical protein [Caldovatus aquaticus]MBW8270224.1 hypothetical protein [Caldovatus aquaticus]